MLLRWLTRIILAQRVSFEAHSVRCAFSGSPDASCTTFLASPFYDETLSHDSTARSLPAKTGADVRHKRQKIDKEIMTVDPSMTPNPYWKSAGLKPGMRHPIARGLVVEYLLERHDEFALDFRLNTCT